VLCGAALLFSSPVLADKIVRGQGQNQTLELGQIQVTGRPMVLKVLQIIKQGLEEPLSTDASKANVVVCRVNDETGSHIKQTLLCATNKAWLSERSTMQANLQSAQSQVAPGSDSFMGVTTCASGLCNSVQFDPLNDALSALPGGFLKTSVDGVELRRLLKNISTPAKVKSSAELKDKNFPAAP
jgi:hypothetical protein